MEKDKRVFKLVAAAVCILAVCGLLIVGCEMMTNPFPVNP